MDQFHVYVAGPISRDPIGGARIAIQAAAALADAGLAPYVPQLCVLWELVSPRAYADWMGIGFAWLRKCDVVLRLPGESKGADLEVAEAERLGIPVFHQVDQVVAWSRSQPGPEELVHMYEPTLVG